MTVFQYLDRWYTVAAGKLRRTRTAEQGKLLPGQTLKEAAAHVRNSPDWSPSYEGAAPAEEASSSESRGPQLTRAATMNTSQNLTELNEWLEARVEAWIEGSKPTPAELSHGHSLVFRICAESSAPANAEQKVYEFYVHVIRRIVTEVEESIRPKLIKPMGV